MPRVSWCALLDLHNHEPCGGRLAPLTGLQTLPGPCKRAPVSSLGADSASASWQASSSRRCCASMAAASGGATAKKPASKSSAPSTKLPKRLLGAAASNQPVSTSHLRAEALLPLQPTYKHIMQEGQCASMKKRWCPGHAA